MEPEKAMEKKTICFQDGKVYFSRAAERLFFLILTAVMAVLGLFNHFSFI